jgi:hypothetical protein
MDMRAFLRWTSLVAAVALLTVVGVRAQTIGGDGTRAQSFGFTRVGGTSADSINRILKMDANGNAKVVDADRDRDLVLGQNSIINATITAASAESSIAFPVGNARHITVWIKASPAVGTDALLGVRLRLHLSSASDSNSIGGWGPRFGMNTNISAAADTVGDTRYGTSVQINPDEVLVLRSGRRRSAGNPGAFNWNSLIPVTYTIAPGAGSYFSILIRNAGGGSCGVVAHYRASAL